MSELSRLIEKSYDCKVKEIEKIKNAYRISTEDGFKCFKASKYDLDQFEFIINAISHLTNAGFKNIMKIHPTIDNKKYIELDRGYGFLCDWVDSREANFDNPVELKMCVETLSKLHLASRGFLPLNCYGYRNQYGKWISKFKRRCDELLYFKALIMDKNINSEFDSIYLKYFESSYKQGLKTIRDLEGSKYYSIMEEHNKLSGFCHHDTANHNFLITADLDIYLIDFDYCIYDTHLHDLSSIIIRNLKYGNWDMDTLEFILDVYGNNIQINAEERYLIFCFMEFPQDFWQIGLQYYVEKQAWEEEFFLRKLLRIVNDSRERFEFLSELEGRRTK